MNRTITKMTIKKPNLSVYGKKILIGCLGQGIIPNCHKQYNEQNWRHLKTMEDVGIYLHMKNERIRQHRLYNGRSTPLPRSNEQRATSKEQRKAAAQGRGRVSIWFEERTGEEKLMHCLNAKRSGKMGWI